MWFCIFLAVVAICVTVHKIKVSGFKAEVAKAQAAAGKRVNLSDIDAL